jgi:drug/metabolite transporter (DMT)-like permease
VAVLGALVVALAGVYVVVAGSSDTSLIGWVLVVVGLVLLPVNIAMRRRGIRAGMRHPFGRR